MIGATLGGYRIIEQIGMGGMATVYKAYDPDTDRYVAVKVLPQHYSQDPRFVERFRREAKAIARLEHMNILPVHAYGEEEGTAYLVMRYMQTGTLTGRLAEGPLPLHEAARLLEQVGGALDHAHRHGIIHRDVKPSNVLLDGQGNAYLTDFGIAKIVEATLELTGTGTALGTPQYMSPEQCRGEKDLTPATDIYSLGVVLYQMVTGQVPFQAETPLAVIQMHLNDPLPPPRGLRPELPEGVERVILKAMAKEPGQRFESAAAMADAFARAVASAPASPVAPTVDVPTTKPRRPTRPRRVPGWALGLIALLVVGGLAGAALFTGLLSAGTGSAPRAARGAATIEALETAVFEAEERRGEAERLRTALAKVGNPQAAAVGTEEPLPAPTSEYVEGEVLFEDDFEGSSVVGGGWRYVSAGWSVELDETGNAVLQGVGSDDRSIWRTLDAGDSRWRNYALEARVRIVEFGSPPWDQGFSFRFRLDLNAGCPYYLWILLSTWVQVGRFNDDCAWRELDRMEGFELPIDTWFVARVEAIDGFMRGYVNGLPIIEAELATPATPAFEYGGIGLHVPPTNVVWFDDVRVVELVPVSEAAAEPSARPGEVVVVANPDCPPPVVTTEDEVIARVRWGATTAELAEGNANHFDFVFLLDGQDLGDIKPYRQSGGTYSSEEVYGCGDGVTAAWVHWDVPLGRLPAGTHTIAVDYILDETISDGFDTYEPGSLRGFLETSFEVLP